MIPGSNVREAKPRRGRRTDARRFCIAPTAPGNIAADIAKPSRRIPYIDLPKIIEDVPRRSAVEMRREAKRSFPSTFYGGGQPPTPVPRSARGYYGVTATAYIVLLTNFVEDIGRLSWQGRQQRRLAAEIRAVSTTVGSVCGGPAPRQLGRLIAQHPCSNQ